ncbi:MAG: response regulator [Anaerolineae bacterium]|nr:MAG: response regulator [Anaerolineae bacterium]
MSIPRILLVDDHRDVLRLLHSALDTLPHELTVIESPSGEEAILESSRERVDLLVADYRLPGINGLELMRKIRERWPDVKVILITGLKEKAVRSELLKAGAMAIFEKPIPLADFLDVVERGLGLERTILPAESAEEEEQRRTLAELLSDFRKRFDAQAVFLVSDRGRVLARAGDLVDSSMEVSLLSAMAAIYSASVKVSRFLHQEELANYHVFQGGDQDMLLLPVNAVHALLVAGNLRLGDGKRLPKVLKGLFNLREEVEKVLRSLGASVPVVNAEEAADVTVEENDEGDHEPSAEELEALLAQAKKTLSSEDVDSFWSKAVKTQRISEPGAISYEQARKLGLAPGDDE